MSKYKWCSKCRVDSCYYDEPTGMWICRKCKRGFTPEAEELEEEPHNLVYITCGVTTCAFYHDNECRKTKLTINKNKICKEYVDKKKIKAGFK